MVFDFKQIGIGFDLGDGLRIALDPTRGDENCGTDFVVDEGLQNAFVGLACAGIKGERNARGHVWYYA